MEFGLFRTKWTVRNRDIIEVSNLVRKYRERCPYYRVCMEFGLFRTMWTVRNREVSVYYRFGRV